MTIMFKRDGFKDLNIIEKKLVEAESLNDVLQMLKKRRDITTANLKLEHSYTDTKLKEDLGDDILT